MKRRRVVENAGSISITRLFGVGVRIKLVYY